MIKFCVDTGGKFFLSLKEKYNISTSKLETIMHSWQNVSEDVDYNSPSFIEYLEDKLGLSKVEYSSKSKYLIAYKAWQKLTERFTTFTEDQVEKVRNTVSQLFGKEDFSIYETSKPGVYTLKVKEPTYINKKEVEEILKNAPRDSEGRLLAPNGNPSNLTEQQYVTVRTKAFKEWFGDWENDSENSSKVVDENGEPLVVYHGSPIIDISSFRLDGAKGFTINGSNTLNIPNTAWFSADRTIAEKTYSILPESLEEREPRYGKVYPVFLNIRTPLVDSLKGAKEEQDFISNYVVSEETAEDFYSRVSKRIASEYKDGFILTFEDTNLHSPSGTSLQTQYGITSNLQVKSADLNQGTYSNTDSNIYRENIEDDSNLGTDSNLISLFNKYRSGAISYVPIKDIITLLYDSEYSSIIELLNTRFGKDIFKGINVQIVSPLNGFSGAKGIRDKFGNRRAFYDAANKTIYINSDAEYSNGNSSAVLLHELMHALTVDKILSNSKSRQTFETILDDYLKKFPDSRYDKNGYLSKDSYLEEFIANIWSDPTTIERLKSLKSSRVNKSLWEEIKDFFANLFSGIFSGTTKDSLMAKASTELIKLLESPVTVRDGKIYRESVSNSTKTLTESKRLIESIISSSRERIKFDPKTHTYYVDGKKADTSVTQYIHGNKDLGDWALPSSTLGTTVDTIARDYFAGTLKKKYPNLTKKQLDTLINSLHKLRKELDDKFGKGNYGVVTTEFPIASKYVEVDKKGRSITKLMAGTMDMLVYDNKGNFYIYDMKTSRSGIKQSTASAYAKQLGLYKSILESNYPELRSKTKELQILEFSLYYPSVSGAQYYSAEDIEDSEEGQLYVEDSTTDGIIPIQEHEDFISPEYKSTIGLSIPKNLPDLKGLNKEEKVLIEEEVGSEPVKSTSSSTVDTKSIQSIGWHNNPLLSATEKRFLAEQAMKLFSTIVSHLQTDASANKKYLGDTFSHLNLTGKDRKTIIEIVGTGPIFNYIKEAFFNPVNAKGISDINTLMKLKVAYDNFSAMLLQGYSKLIALEDVTVIHTRPEFIKREDLEESLDGEYEQGNLEEKEREYWQIGQRQISAKSSLSSSIRRMFERLPVVDQNGNPVKDTFGFNMATYVDANEAVNSILEWVHNAATMEEMEVILQSMTPSNPWLNNILKAIKEEPIRSQFFQNFRKDFTTYSVVRVEYDSTGKRKYVTDIINTKGVLKTILSKTASSYKLGLMTNIIIPIKGDLEGRGRVNVTKVEELKEIVDKELEALRKNFSRGNRKISDKSIDNIALVLSSLGLPITTAMVKFAVYKDSSKKTDKATKTNSILENLIFLLDTILDNKDNTEYNPMLKGEEGNIYTSYKNIINIFSPYIKDSVESSVYENGKMYYSFTTPSYMGKLINRLSDKLEDSSKFKEFIESEYGSYRWFKDGNVWKCPWLERIVNNESLRHGLQHKVQLSFDKTDYVELSELSYTLSLMQEYFYDKGKKWAWYRLPILANKPSSEFIRFERISGANYKTTIKKGLKKVFDQELMRIATVLERAINPDIADSKIGAKGKIWFDIKSIDKRVATKIKNGTLTAKDFSAFVGSGAEFKFLSALNIDVLNNTELGKLIIDKINIMLNSKSKKSINEDTLSKLFNTAVDTYMKQIVESHMNNWTNLGLFDTEEVTRNIDGKSKTIERYKYVSQLGKSLEEIKGNLEEYIWNDMFATINIIELTATDLAYYKNVEDFQKRYSQVHAPSMRLNTTATFLDKNGNKVRYSADGMARTMYLADSEISSSIIPNIAKVFDDKIRTLTGNAKKEMEIMKTLIVQAFEKVNVADAQGYSSPTSYRKKLGMQGKWTEEMEEAYHQIHDLKNFNIDDLSVLLQPLKPFVYSNIRKNSGATTMSELRVPVQNKNSEYLLLIADALMRAGNQSNKLQALFDFMEDSAYDNGVYNGKGIDTIQFISAVNSGGMGALVIPENASYEEVISILEEKAYYNTDRSETEDNDMDRYDERFVHTISFEDYGIQQEVPAHMSDHFQPMGSQVRILSVSDITPNTDFIINGEEIKGEELQKEYFDLLANNIKNSYKELIKELGLKGNRREQNRKLSELLQRTILKDQRYGSDLLRACELDSNDEFIIPLSDPIQSVRIQQLLNSIIKSRINKQEVPGGPTVQVSAYGLSADLSIIWQDEDGNLSTSKKFNIKKQKSVAYFECYAPIPSKQLAKDLLKPDGSYMSPEDALAKGIIKEDMLKAIAYRIPTEDKYSILPIKIKGFVPKAAGEAVILPKEITTLTGSDFDIDKMYIMFKEFSKEEKVDWSSLEKDAIEIFTKGKNKKATIKEVKAAIKKVKVGKEVFEENSLELDVYDLLNDNINKYKTTEYKEDKSRNNRIFDIQWAVLTHKDTMSKMFNPGSFDVQKKTARIITILKSGIHKYAYKDLQKMTLEELDKIASSSSNLNIIFPSTQVYFHKQNMTAGKLIGIFANNNTSHAFLSMQDIHFNIPREDAFTFGGYTIGLGQNTKVDNIWGKDGMLISKTIAGFLAASVDAVKDPVLNYMNLNSMTAGPAMVLARLGFDSDSIGLLLTQPIIEKLSSEYFKRNNEGYISIEDLITEILNNLKNNRGIDYTLLEKDLKNTKFTKEQLAEELSKGLDTTEFQVRSLLLFKRLSEMAKDLGNLTFLTKFNSVTNAAGPTIADTFVLKERYNKFMEDMESKVPPFTMSAKNIFENNSMLQAFFECTVGNKGAAHAIFSTHFPHYSSAFTSALTLYRKSTKGNVDSKTINKLINDFILYVLTCGKNPVLDGSVGSRKKYIIDFPNIFASLSKDIIDNDFIKAVSITPTNNRCPVPVLDANSGGYSIDIQERIKDGWSNLLLNPETVSLGEDMFFYNLIRNGFNFSPKTLGHLASVDVRRSISGYIDALRNFEILCKQVNIVEFINQFKRNHTEDKKVVPELTKSKDVRVTKKKNVRGENTITITSKNSTYLNSIIANRGKDGSVTWCSVIKYEGKIYMAPFGETSTCVNYIETSALGNTNNFLEYDGNDSSKIESVLNSVETSEKPIASSREEHSYEDKRRSIDRSLDRAIERAIDDVFQTKEANDIDTGKEFMRRIPKMVLTHLNMGEGILPIIEAKISKILSDNNICI